MVMYPGPETKKACDNFGEERLPRDLIRAYGEVKFAVLSAIQEEEAFFSVLHWECISLAIEELISGLLDDYLCIPLMQGGAGTSINMCINETIAMRANSLLEERGEKGLLDSVEHINRYQSTNDTFTTAITIAVFRKLIELEKLVIDIQKLLADRERSYAGILMAGRTEMQDALPITLGQVFGSWAGMFERDRWRLNKIKERLRTIALGGTAVGTGFPVPASIVFASEARLREITGLPLARSQNLPDEIANLDKYTELAHGIRQVCDNIFKLTGDLLIYTSSQTGELVHPELQSGSSIMAAKTNPVLLEYARGLSIAASYSALSVSEYSRNGQLQLNAFLPFVCEELFRAFELAKKALAALIRLIPKLEVNKKRIEENLLRSHILLNALLPVIGYRRVKELYHSHPEPFLSTHELADYAAKKTGLDKKKILEAIDIDNITSFGGRKNA
ncbi:lyase family protein [Spirochaetia bacterium 38H-sp]|uniref:Lyase family protein n=1 Tax=Rarispira pelagica TaxID=3141764 RepID=A0ABU9UCC8_9SPIR